MNKQLVVAGAMAAVLLASASVASAEDNERGRTGTTLSISDVRERANATTTREDRDEMRAEKDDDRISRAKERAHEEIERRIKALESQLSRLLDMKIISDELKASITASVQAQIQELKALKDSVETEDAVDELRSDIKELKDSHRVFSLVIPRATIAAHAERLQAIAAQLTDFGAKLQARIREAAATGADVSEAEGLMTDYGAKIDAAKADIQAAIDAAASVSTSVSDENGRNAVLSELKDIRAKLQSALRNLKDAREIAGKIRSLLARLQGDSSGGDGDGDSGDN